MSRLLTWEKDRIRSATCTQGQWGGAEATFEKLLMPGSAFHRLESVQLARIAARMRLSLEEVEDAVQETWLEAVEHRAEFVGADVERRLRAWLRKVVASNATDLRRRLARSPREAPEGSAYELLDELDGMDAAAAELHEWLTARLATARAGDDENVRLLCGHFLHGRSHKELAEEWGLTVKAVEGRIGRTLKRLRALAEDDLELGEAPAESNAARRGEKIEKNEKNAGDVGVSNGYYSREEKTEVGKAERAGNEEQHDV